MTNSGTGFSTGLIIGVFPTVAMIAAIFLLTNVEVGARVEAALQNFAAGLILAAVACELFPIMKDGNGDINASYIGISIGFVIALATIYGIEYFVHKLEEWPNENESTHSKSDKPGYSSVVPAESRKSLIKTAPKGLDEMEHGEVFKDLEAVQYEDQHLELASQAINSSDHKKHIQEHLEELLESIKFMQERAIALANQNLSVREAENIAESIDERIHALQYKLDHCRRLVQGSEADTFTDQDTCHATSSTWVTEERKDAIRKGLSTLHNTVEHLLEHIAEPNIDKHVLKEIRIHMDHMDKQISTFHESIEHVAAKWTRILPKVDTNEGDTLPMGLVLPVCMDGFVDGFLIGITSAISLKAGIILSTANCLEMSFLGMAYASRLVKCTGSSKSAVNLALYGPPLLMLLASGLGGAIGVAVQAIPIIFVALVSFGAVALLFLVCNELLIEAREAQGDDEKWYISIMVFLGIYLVLMLDHVI